MRRLIFAFIVILAAGIASQSAHAAKPAIEEIIKELSAEPGATKVSISPFAMWLGKAFTDDSSDPEDQLYKKVKALNVLAFENCDKKKQDKIMKRLGKLTADGYEEMIRVNDDGDNVVIFAKINKETIHRLVIVALSEDDCALVDIKGNFGLDELDQLVNDHTAKGDDGK